MTEQIKDRADSVRRSIEQFDAGLDTDRTAALYSLQWLIGEVVDLIEHVAKMQEEETSDIRRVIERTASNIRSELRGEVIAMNDSFARATKRDTP